MTEQQAEHLDSWLVETQESGISALRQLSTNLCHNYQAVQQAFCSVWSNGQVEGQGNRLMVFKRTMYGRASFNLLRKQVVDWVNYQKWLRTLYLRNIHPLVLPTMVMSTVPEVIVANQMAIAVFGVSIITDMYIPETLEKADIQKIIAAAGTAEPHLTRLMRSLVSQL